MNGVAELAFPLATFAKENSLALTRFAYLVFGDRGRAEDAVQDVLLAMHRRFGPALSVDDPVAYARRAIVNARVDTLRRRHLHEVLSDRMPEDLAQTDGPTGDDRVWETMVALPSRQRTVLVLRYYIGYTDREIADLLGCRESSVRSLATRAFKTLRPLLRPAEPDPEAQK